MSAAVLTSREARRPVRPTWWQTVGAVIGGSMIAWAITLGWMLPLAIADPFPFFTGGETSGRGWPWRIEGPWSFAADVGPLLLCGSAFACGVEQFTVKWTGVRRPRRLPLALAAAAVGWVLAANASRAGLVEVSGLVAFTGVAAVARECSVRERRRVRWTRGRIALAAAAVLGLAGVSASYGLLHPLSAGYGGAPVVTAEHGRAEVSLYVRNDGRRDVRVLAVDAPGLQVVRVRTDHDVLRSAPTVDELLTPIAGARIGAHESRSAYLTIALPHGCGEAAIDRLHVWLRVAGRDVRQVVRIEAPLRFACT